MALHVKGVVDGSVNGKEARGGSWSFEAGPRSFPSAPYYLIAKVQAPLGYEVLNIAQTEVKAQVKSFSVLSDRRRIGKSSV
tara:strand:- start:2099 stop:2341 length:243 start_codon:yes stop_codon:yes gene_type:complete